MTGLFYLSDDLSKYDGKKITLLIIKNGCETLFTSVAEFINDIDLGPIIKLPLATYCVFIQNVQDFSIDDKYGGDYIVKLTYYT